MASVSGNMMVGTTQPPQPPQRSGFETCLSNAYATPRPLAAVSCRRHATRSLPEDVGCLLRVHGELLEEERRRRFSVDAEADEERFTDAVYGALHALFCVHVGRRDRCILDVAAVGEDDEDEDPLEALCAAANDCFRLMETVEAWIESMHRRHPCLLLLPPENGDEDFDVAQTAQQGIGSPRSRSGHHREASDLLRLYFTDAVRAAQSTGVCFAETMDEATSAGTGLFGTGWDRTALQLDAATEAKGGGPSAAARTMMAVLKEFLSDMEDWLCHEALLRKAVGALVSATVAFYVRALAARGRRIRLKQRGGAEERRTSGNRIRLPKSVQYRILKGEKDYDNEEEGVLARPFAVPSRAVLQIRFDAHALRGLFQTWTLQEPSLDRTVVREFAAIHASCECLASAARGILGLGDSFDFVGMLCRSVNCDNADVTRILLRDLVSLAAPGEGERAAVTAAMESALRQTLERTPSENEEGRECEIHPSSRRGGVPDLNLGFALGELYVGDYENQTLGQTWKGKGVSLRTLRSARLSSVKLPARAKKGAKSVLETCRKAGEVAKERAVHSKPNYF